MDDQQLHSVLEISGNGRHGTVATPGHPEVSIAIVTWNSRQLLEECLNSIYTGTNQVEFEIILVDNASRDGTAELLRRRFSQVRLIENAKRLSVAAARNQALKAAAGDFVLLIDVETRISPMPLKRWWLCQSMPESGIIGAKIIDAAGNLQLTCRRFPTAFTFLLRRLQFIPFFHNSQMLREQAMADWDHNTIREVDYVLGAC
jgi:GT2 family glycosyltransferase